MNEEISPEEVEKVLNKIRKKLGLLTPEEMAKVHEFFNAIYGAYYRFWFSKPIFNHGKAYIDLKKAKKILEELGI